MRASAITRVRLGARARIRVTRVRLGARARMRGRARVGVRIRISVKG